MNEYDILFMPRHMTLMQLLHQLLQMRRDYGISLRQILSRV
jgi:hypothetical protein